MVKRLNFECIRCLTNKYFNNLPSDATQEQKLKFLQEFAKIIAFAEENSGAPELVEKIVCLEKEIFEKQSDFSDIKGHFNKLMLSLENEFASKIENSSDKLKTAILLSMAANYIDFAAMDNVDEKKLYEILNAAESIELNEAEFINLKTDILNAKKIVYLTDNCGEIVLDKLLIKLIKEQNPSAEICVIVRGKPVVNDCTIDDAKQVGLLEIVKVIDNGTAIGGTCLNKVCAEAKEYLDNADVIISKGQGNFETLRHCNKNIYYLFLCKCQMFAKKFGVNLFSGMLVNDLRL